MQIVIPCGGLGTRLRPLTKKIPKPMMQIQGRPFLEWQMEYLKKYGADEFVLCIGYLGHQIKSYFDNTDNDANIKYSEDDGLGVYGAIKTAESLLDDKFLMVYGDSYPIHLNLSRFWNSFWNADAEMCIATWINKNRIDGSNLRVEDGELISVDTDAANAVDVGATVLSKDALQYIPKGEAFSTADIREVMFKNGLLDIYLTNGRFYHIGNHEALEEVKELVGRKDVGE